MGNGTLVARAARAGVGVWLVCATRGDAGWNNRPPGRRREELPAIRTEELARAAEILGLAGHELWDYPDGGVPSCDQDEITARIREVVDRLDPDVVVGWGPDGGYGHPDHIAVGACTDAALRATPRPHYHMALDAKGAEGYRSAIAAMGIETDMRFVASERVDVTLEPSEAELEIVGRAIAAHDSQRNEMVDRILSDPRLLFQMARNCYTRVTGVPTPPATDTLPELVPAPGRPLARQA